ncbi:hypothetical protein EJ110_NYTH35001 [Nymphaea thermarum]|nr:hypothetical protein EJ110_NYTH35001 [Nymphaea thermarum]
MQRIWFMCTLTFNFYHEAKKNTGETKYWDVNVEDFNLEEDNELELEAVNSRFEEPSIPSTCEIVEEEDEDDLDIDND